MAPSNYSGNDATVDSQSAAPNPLLRPSPKLANLQVTYRGAASIANLTVSSVTTSLVLRLASASSLTGPTDRSVARDVENSAPRAVTLLECATTGASGSAWTTRARA